MKIARQTVIFFALLLIAGVLGISERRRIKKSSSKGFGDGDVYTFDDQLVDHFNPTDQDQFSQRYWVWKQSFSTTKGVVFLYICGEYDCEGALQDRQWPLQLASNFSGMVIAVEHRYYGQSIPLTQPYLTQNLKYLTVDNALQDLAYFQNWIVNNQMYGITKNTPWICIGGSYAGAVSAWYRLKFPFLTIGGLASSAVVNPIYNFTQYDMQVFNTSQYTPSNCSMNIQKLNDYVEQQLQDPIIGPKIKSNFSATKLSDPEFLFYFADIFAGRVQYSDGANQCDELNVFQNLNDMYLHVLNYALQNNITAYDYGVYYLSNATFAEVTKDEGRPWTYQWCSQFGWLQPYSPFTQGGLMYRARSVSVNLTMFYSLCTGSFEDIFQTQASIDNNILMYGGNQIQATKLIMTNGLDDPWQWAGITTERQNIHVITITGNGHCSDLDTPTPSDNQSLKSARDQEWQIMNKWINDHYNKISQQQQKVPKNSEL